MKEDRLLEMEVFKAVAEHGSFTAAADALGASQPFVSRIVTRLEERFGVALLSRSTRQLRLTDEGRLFLQSCQRILNEVEHAERMSLGRTSGHFPCLHRAARATVLLPPDGGNSLGTSTHPRARCT